jgi:hypothetical protein
VVLVGSSQRMRHRLRPGAVGPIARELLPLVNARRGSRRLRLWQRCSGPPRWRTLALLQLDLELLVMLPLLRALLL